MTSRFAPRVETIASACVATLILTLTAGGAVQAQQAPKVHVARGAGALPSAATAPMPADGDVWSFSAGVDAVSQYISRGVAFVDAPSVQPYASVGLSLPQFAGDTVKNVKLSVGTWNSMQFGDPGLGQINYGPWAGWYESDLYTALNFGFAGGWSASFAVYYYHSPSHSFDDYGDLEAIVRYDDSKHWKGKTPLRHFALMPQLRVTRSIGRAAGTNSTYWQPSLTPSFTVGGEDHPVRIGIPLAIGLSDRYYTGVNGGHVTFGYFRTGVTAATTLAKVDNALWQLTGGVDVWFTNPEVASGLADTEVVGRIGTSVSF